MRQKWVKVIQQDWQWLLIMNLTIVLPSWVSPWFTGFTWIYSPWWLQCHKASAGHICISAWRHSDIPISPAKPPGTGRVTPIAKGSHWPHNSLEPCRQPLVHKLRSTPAFGLSETVREGNSAKEKLLYSSSHKEFLFWRRHLPIINVLVRQTTLGSVPVRKNKLQ